MVIYSRVQGAQPLINSVQSINMFRQAHDVQAGFSSSSCSSSSLSSLTIPSSILSSLSLWPSRYLGLGAALVVNSPPGRARSSPNRVSLASLSIAFARHEAKVSRDLCTSAWTWTEDVFVFSAEEKSANTCYVTANKCQVECAVAWWPQRHFSSLCSFMKRGGRHIPLECSTWSSKVTELLLFPDGFPWCGWWEEPSVEKLSSSITSVPV